MMAIPDSSKLFLKVMAILIFVFLFILVHQALAIAVQPQVAAGSGHTVGLKSEGTVMAVGYNELGQLNVDTWNDIQQVSAGSGHTVGLKSNGTVVAAASDL